MLVWPRSKHICEPTEFNLRIRRLLRVRWAQGDDGAVAGGSNRPLSASSPGKRLAVVRSRSVLVCRPAFRIQSIRPALRTAGSDISDIRRTGAVFLSSGISCGKASEWFSDILFGRLDRAWSSLSE